jgi:hypothetical protein
MKQYLATEYVCFLVLNDGIGKAVDIFFSLENRELSSKASELYDKWKTMIERRVELSLAKTSELKRAELEVQV